MTSLNLSFFWTSSFFSITNSGKSPLSTKLKSVFIWNPWLWFFLYISFKVLFIFFYSCKVSNSTCSSRFLRSSFLSPNYFSSWGCINWLLPFHKGSPRGCSRESCSSQYAYCDCAWSIASKTLKTRTSLTIIQSIFCPIALGSQWSFS